MAIDICSEISSPVISPRISFSHDLKEADFDSNTISRSEALLSNSTIDFDFCLTQNSFSQHFSSADELFANGKILPVQIKKIPPPHKQIQPISRKSTTANVEEAETTTKKRLIEFLSFDTEENQKPFTKSFWQFRRSSSFNCDNGKTTSNYGLLKFLTRSNSTGSAPNPKSQKAIQKQNSLKETESAYGISRFSNSSSGYNPYYLNNSSTSSKGSNLKKSSSKSYGVNGGGVRINPVLNIPPTYIAKGTVSLFGIGSLFFSSKKSKKKKK